MPLDDNPTHSQLSIGASFANALAFVECVREEAIRSNKQLERQPGRGRNCIFKCASPGCGWFIQANLTTIRRDGIAGNYVVKKSQTQHAEDCSCTLKFTSSELSQNAVFRDAIQRIGNGTRAQIEAELKISGIYTNSLSSTAFYRAKKAALREISCGSDHTMTTSKDNDNNNLYHYLPSYLEQFCKLNGHSTCALQLDSKGRFLRCFLCPGSAVHVFGASFQILWTIGMQSKTEDYVGVHLFLIGRDATGGSFPLAVSFIPNESCFHMSWFIQMCLRAGFPMQDVPIFSHRGNLLAAACHLKKQLGVELNVKYCREYIAQNIVETFKVPSQHLGQVKQGVYMVQEAPTFAGYDAALEALEKEISLIPQMCTTHLKEYLRDIDPIHWCVFANRGTQASGYKICSREVGEQEGAASSPLFATIPKGKPCVLYGLSTSNDVMNNVLHSIEGACDQIPPLALQRYCGWFTNYYHGKKVVAGGMAQEKDRLEKGHYRPMTLTDHGISILGKETESSYSLGCEPFGHDVGSDGFYVYNVTPRGLSLQTTKVKIHSTHQQCQCLCLVYEQHTVACRHIIATLRFLAQDETCRQRHDSFDEKEMLHQCFDKVYWTTTFIDGLLNAVVEIPSNESMDPGTSSAKEAVLPPPRYMKWAKGQTATPETPRQPNFDGASGPNSSCCNIDSSKNGEAPSTLFPGRYVFSCTNQVGGGLPEEVHQSSVSKGSNALYELTDDFVLHGNNFTGQGTVANGLLNGSVAEAESAVTSTQPSSAETHTKSMGQPDDNTYTEAVEEVILKTPATNHCDSQHESRVIAEIPGDTIGKYCRDKEILDNPDKEIEKNGIKEMQTTPDSSFLDSSSVAEAPSAVTSTQPSLKKTHNNPLITGQADDKDISQGFQGNDNNDRRRSSRVKVATPVTPSPQRGTRQGRNVRGLVNVSVAEAKSAVNSSLLGLAETHKMTVITSQAGDKKVIAEAQSAGTSTLPSLATTDKKPVITSQADDNKFMAKAQSAGTSTVPSLATTHKKHQANDNKAVAEARSAGRSALPTLAVFVQNKKKKKKKNIVIEIHDDDKVVETVDYVDGSDQSDVNSKARDRNWKGANFSDGKLGRRKSHQSDDSSNDHVNSNAGQGNRKGAFSSDGKLGRRNPNSSATPIPQPRKKQDQDSYQKFDNRRTGRLKTGRLKVGSPLRHCTQDQGPHQRYDRKPGRSKVDSPVTQSPQPRKGQTVAGKQDHSHSIPIGPNTGIYMDSYSNFCNAITPNESDLGLTQTFEGGTSNLEAASTEAYHFYQGQLDAQAQPAIDAQSQAATPGHCATADTSAPSSARNIGMRSHEQSLNQAIDVSTNIMRMYEMDMFMRLQSSRAEREQRLLELESENQRRRLELESEKLRREEEREERREFREKTYQFMQMIMMTLVPTNNKRKRGDEDDDSNRS